MGLRLLTAPAEEPVTLAEAKAHLRVSVSDDDDYIGALITAARQHIDGKDGILGRAICTQTWELILDRFPDDLRIPLPPLQSVQSITYVDEGGVEQTLPPDQYTVDNVNEPGWVVVGPNGWPDTGDYINAVRVRFVAGYDPVPHAVKVAMLLLIGHWYENREAVNIGNITSSLPFTVDALLSPYRVYLF